MPEAQPLNAPSEAQIIEPTVGRIVLYRERPGQRLIPGIITKVHGTRRIDLTVFPAGVDPHPLTEVRLCQPDDEGDANPHAEWMPYQVRKPFGSESGEKAAGSKSI